MAGIPRSSPDSFTDMASGSQSASPSLLRMKLANYSWFSIGSMDGATLVTAEDLPSPTGKGPSRPAIVMPLQGSTPHAVMFDITHDNESPLDKRSAEDALSTGALVTFAYCGVGSNKGFDDLYPKLLNLV